jgi:DNA segregation ATPase FtsK/SpoIIIE, S-DNA-T family
LEQLAADSMSGHAGLGKLLQQEPKPASEKPGDPEELLRKFQEQMRATEELVRTFRGRALPAFFRSIPLAGWLVVILAACGVLGFIMREHPAGLAIAGGLAIGLCGLMLGLHRLTLVRGKAGAQEIAGGLAECVRIYTECKTAAAAKHEADRQAVQDHYDRTKADIDAQWKRADEIEDDYTWNAEVKFEHQIPRSLASADRILAGRLARIQAAAGERRKAIEAEAAAQRASTMDAQRREIDALAMEESDRWETLTTDWNREITRLYDTIRQMEAALAPTSPTLDLALAEQWTPPARFTPATRFAELEIDLAALAPKDKRLGLPGPAQARIPVALTYPEQGCLLLEADESGTTRISGALNLLILRLLATMPPGKVSFTILDPVGLGQNFAGLMHLADYEENLINRRIWTQRDQIDERLAELNEHIEKVIQMYLRNEFATISEYNAQAGSVAEKYHFLIVADFPGNFGETATKRLQSIVSSGPRCGVFTLMHWDRRQPASEDLIAEELRKNSVALLLENGAWVLGPAQKKAEATLRMEPAPEANVAAALVHKIGKASVDSNRVEVPFAQIAPAPENYWTSETTHELRVPIGRTGATKMQYLAIGKGTRQHALFAGKTGSGKSTLFHVIITNLALSCSPEQVEFYLIDFKKGVEFKCYASKHLPHARVIAIESDREFGLSVLQRVDDELKRRGDMFRKLGVQDVAGYKKAGGTEPMPRSLLLIDEFQEFFVEDDAIAQGASMLFDRIVRQGRAFGIHVLLGSQTLGGAYTLARATLGQMVIRVALQCNEADAYLIMDESNSAPRLLSRPGEGIYNDAAGAVEGNSPFQVVWLPDDERDRLLDRVHDLALKRIEHPAQPIVFEGNAPADIHENKLLTRVFATPPTQVPGTARAWLGAPNAIKGPTELVFHRQSGNHLLIAGQREEAALTMLGISMLALVAQYPPGAARFIFCHASVPGSPEEAFVRRLAAAVPAHVKIATAHEVPDLVAELSADLKARSSGEAAQAPEVFVFIHGLPRFKKLRYEDDFSFGSGEAGPGAQFSELINDGSSYGIHLLVSVDTFNNLNRFVNRKALGEFEMRVVFQMSANDSASLIDSPKASDLGLHRAILYNESQGQMETFRPYATPDGEWFENAAKALAQLK